MNEKHLHILCLDTPWPVNYGGVVDLFYKIKALHQQGIKIHLHCFAKKVTPQPELNKYCVDVNYYQRNTGIFNFSFSLPYMVSSRKSEKLISVLSKDNYPILFEGIQCSYPLYRGAVKHRKFFVRLHNVEFEYYKQLGKNEPNMLRKLFFQYQSYLLKKYEKSIAHKASFITVSQSDSQIYKDKLCAKSIHFLPVFIAHDQVNVLLDKGSYCLYHGNLSINENENAVLWLLQKIFSKTSIPFVVAGRNPSKKLIRHLYKNSNCCIVENPTEIELTDLVKKAQVNVLPSFNNTGVKLKLINALFMGRHCVTNSAGVLGSGLEELCDVSDTPEEMMVKIKELFEMPLTQTQIDKRKARLQNLYNNEENVKDLISLIWG